MRKFRCKLYREKKTVISYTCNSKQLENKSVGCNGRGNSSESAALAIPLIMDLQEVPKY